MLPKDDRSLFIWLGALNLVTLGVIGAVHVPYPYTSDQASFTIGASMSGASETLRFIHRNYRVVRSDTTGTWYALADR